MNTLDVVVATSGVSGESVSDILFSSDMKHSALRLIVHVVCERLGIREVSSVLGREVTNNHMAMYKKMMNKTHKKMIGDVYTALKVTPPDSVSEYILHRGEDYIKLETLSGVYEVIDASSKHFGKATAGLKDGNILVYGTCLDDTLLAVLHQDICNKINTLTMKEIRKAWNNS